MPQTLAVFDLKHLASAFHEKVDALIWDVDGTLFYKNEAKELDEIGRFFKEALKEEHGIIDESCYRPKAGIHLPVIKQQVEEKFGVTLNDRVLHNIWEHRKLSPYNEESLEIHPFFRSVLETCHALGIDQCMATSSEFDRAERHVIQANLQPYFEHRIQKDLPYICAGKKPDPACYNLALATHEALYGRPANPKNSISFEDSLSGVKAAVNAGVLVIGHTIAAHISDDRKDKILEDMRLAGAAATIRDAHEAVPVLTNVLMNMSLKAPVYQPKG